MKLRIARKIIKQHYAGGRPRPRHIRAALLRVPQWKWRTIKLTIRHASVLWNVASVQSVDVLDESGVPKWIEHTFEVKQQ